MKFYKKTNDIKLKGNIDIFQLLSGDTRLSMSFDLIKNGVSANEAFKFTTLDNFLVENSKPEASNKQKYKELSKDREMKFYTF